VEGVSALSWRGKPAVAVEHISSQSLQRLVSLGMKKGRVAGKMERLRNSPQMANFTRW
jgi:hypothetical protein